MPVPYPRLLPARGDIPTHPHVSLIYNPRFRALGGCYYIILPPPASSSPAKKAVAGISMKLFSNSGSVKIISLAVYRCIDGVCFLCGLVCTAVLQMVVLCPIGWGDGGLGAGGWGCSGPWMVGIVSWWWWWWCFPPPPPPLMTLSAAHHSALLSHEAVFPEIQTGSVSLPGLCMGWPIFG